MIARTRVMAAAAIAAALAAASGCSAAREATKAQPEPSRPNVLVIMTDDQRAPGTLAVMPNTRRIFARGGTRFANAFATTPLCCPSRASIVSGLYGHNHGVHTNDDAENLDQDATIQAYLRRAGYQTAMTGKYLNRWDPQVDPPHFDRWAQWLSGWYYDSLYNIDGKTVAVDRYSTDYIAARALDLLDDLETEDDEPWLLYVWPVAPHSPFVAAPEDKGAHVPSWGGTPATRDKDVTDEPDFVQDYQSSTKRARYVRRKQLRTLLAVDDAVGRIFDKLDALDEADNTLAFYMSDNGFMWGEHGIVGKRYPFTESIQIPLLARWPAGGITPGAVDERLVANLDVAATIAHAADLGDAVVEAMDGISLLTEEARSRILIEQWLDDESPVPTMASLRTHDYQYVEYYSDEGSVRDRAYYDLRNDPWQLTNLLGDDDRGNDPDISQLSLRLQADRSCRGSTTCP